MRKRKILPLLAIGILVLSGLGAVAIPESENEQHIEITNSISFSAPAIKNIGKYVTVDIQETDLTLKVSGKPEMSMVPYSIDLPFRAKNIQITCTPSNEQEQELQEKISPTPQVVPLIYDSDTTTTELIEDPEVYSSADRYPSTWYDSKVTCGLNSNKKRVTHISIYLYPVQYSPALNKIFYIDEVTITITYDNPEHVMSFDDEYDLVIIAPQKFSRSLQKLVQHKNDNNVATILKTTEEIYDEYTGLDKPEQIKKYIQDAIETYNITYVLLVGGLKRYFNADDRDDSNQGTKHWHLPARYTNIEKTGLSDPGALCDLYYADVYREGGLFEDWDSNDDGILAHWNKYPGTPADDLDLNPDVYAARLPCRNRLEVAIVVRKIIQYEKTSPESKPWMDTMVGIAGLSHDFYQGQPDGEYLCDLAFGYMEALIEDEVRVYASNNDSGGPIPVPDDIVQAFTSGAGYIYFSGHGHPLRWDTHPVEGTGTWMGGIHERDMWKFFNFRKLPIVVVGGCHNAQFNITWYKTRHSPDFGDDQYYWTHGDPGPICFNWVMIMVPWGGAIASVGGTGLTSSLVGQPVSGNGEIATNIFYEIGQDGATTFGQAYCGAIQKFIDENTVGLWESHCITIYNSFGDPSLQLGGIS